MSDERNDEQEVLNGAEPDDAVIKELNETDDNFNPTDLEDTQEVLEETEDIKSEPIKLEKTQTDYNELSQKETNNDADGNANNDGSAIKFDYDQDGFNQEMPTEYQQPRSKNKKLLGLVFAVVVLGGALAFGFQSGMISGNKKTDMPIAYVKDDALYIDDLKNEPYMAADTLSNGGTYSYYYTAWGVTPSSDGKTLYYNDNVSEDGRFDLYKRSSAQARKNVPGGESLLVAEQVMNYRISKGGTTCAYLKAVDDEKIGLYTAADKPVLITDNAVLNENSFQISEDGRYIVYEKANEDGTISLCFKPTAGGEEKILTDALVQFSVASETEKIYYVAQVENSFTIYEYEYGKEPILIGENAVAMEVLGNNKDVLFCTESSTKIKNEDIIEDDMAEADAAVKTPDFGISSDEEEKKYDEKAARDEIRLALADGDFGSLMQDCYIWSDGKATLVEQEILNAKAAAGSEGYVLFSKIDTANLPKVKLSSVTSLDEAKYMYYVNLSGAPRNTFFANANGAAVNLNSDNIGADSFAVSANGKRIAYDTVDALTGSSKFFTQTFDGATALGEPIELGENIQMNEFSGEGEALYWMEIAQSSTQEGKLMTFANGKPEVITEKASGYRVAEDSQAVYYISDIDELTGNGKISMYQNGSNTEIDTNTFCLQYKGNGKLVYMKDYDLNTGIGDLYYWNGKESRLVDKGVSAIFIF